MSRTISICASLLRTLLNSIGIREIHEASNGAAALEVLREKTCDLVLSDLAMKPMDGIEFTREMRQSARSPNPFMPIIMITGHTEKHRVEAARDAGRHRIPRQADHAAKPVLAHRRNRRTAARFRALRAAISAPTGAARRWRIMPARGAATTISTTCRCNSHGKKARRSFRPTPIPRW